MVYTDGSFMCGKQTASYKQALSSTDLSFYVRTRSKVKPLSFAHEL